jgi:hypothetical protein
MGPGLRPRRRRRIEAVGAYGAPSNKDGPVSSTRRLARPLATAVSNPTAAPPAGPGAPPRGPPGTTPRAPRAPSVRPAPPTPGRPDLRRVARRALTMLLLVAAAVVVALYGLLSAWYIVSGG